MKRQLNWMIVRRVGGLRCACEVPPAAAPAAPPSTSIGVESESESTFRSVLRSVSQVLLQDFGPGIRV